MLVTCDLWLVICDAFVLWLFIMLYDSYQSWVWIVDVDVDVECGRKKYASNVQCTVVQFLNLKDQELSENRTTERGRGRAEG